MYEALCYCIEMHSQTISLFNMYTYAVVRYRKYKNNRIIAGEGVDLHILDFSTTLNILSNVLFFIEILCPEIFPLPYTSVTCPNGRIYGSTCEFKCDNGSESNFQMRTYCGRHGEKYFYGLWNFGNYQPYCERKYMYTNEINSNSVITLDY